jgi:hypothetical protein
MLSLAIVRRATLADLRAAKAELEQHHQEPVSCAEALHRSQRACTVLINLREQDRRWWQGQVRAVAAQAAQVAQEREAANPRTAWDWEDAATPEDRLRLAMERADQLGTRVAELQAANEANTTALRELRQTVADHINAGLRHDNPVVRAYTESFVGTLDTPVDEAAPAEALTGGTA